MNSIVPGLIFTASSIITLAFSFSRRDASADHSSAPHESSSHDHHGGSCGYKKVCCKKQFVPHHLHHGGPGHCRGPRCPPPGPYHGGRGGYGGYGGYGHGGHSSYGYGRYGPSYGSHLTHSVYPSHGYSGGYGHGGYYPTYPQTYSGGYYPSYHTPYYPSYGHYPPRPYPPRPYGGYGATPYFSGQLGHPDLAEADDHTSQNLSADGEAKSAAPAARTSRMFM